MSLIAIPYTFVAGTTIASAQVNADFQAVVNVVNGNIDTSNISTVFTTLKLVNTSGTAAFAGGFYLQWGIASSAALDNSSPVSVTFNTAFPTLCMGVWTQIFLNTQTKAYLATSYPSNQSTTGFTLNAEGGPAGSNANICWLALGW